MAMGRSGRYQIDPRRLSYVAAPPVPAWLARALRRFGRNPFGGDLLKLRWGCDWLEPAFGRLIPRQVAAQRVERRTLHGVGRVIRAADGTVLRTVTTWYGESAARLPQVLQAGEVYVRRPERRVELMGPPLWFMTQWRPAHMLSSPAEWDRDRWVYRTRQEFPGGVWCAPLQMWRFDTLGPYPATGRYELVFTVEGAPGEYVSLEDCGAEVVTEIERRIFLRNQYRASRAQGVRDHYYERERREERAGDELYDHLRSWLQDHRTHLVEGDSFHGYRAPQPTAPRTLINGQNVPA